MRKKTSIFLGVLFLTIVMILPANISKTEATTAEKEMRAVWVPTVLNLSYPLQATTDSELLKSQAITILDSAKDMGFNTIFFQISLMCFFFNTNILLWIFHTIFF